MNSEHISTLRLLRRRLRRVDYSSDRIRRLLAATTADDIGVLGYAAACARLRKQSPYAATAARLFFLEQPQPIQEVEAALTADLCQRLHQLKLIRSAGRHSLRARLRIDPATHAYLMSDHRFQPVDRNALFLPMGDQVYPWSSDSVALMTVALHPEAQSHLDLCTGTGALALGVETKAKEIIAVDINRRASELALANAVMNGRKIKVCTGDLYQPVSGMKFDLITANPPFVRSPYKIAPSFHSGGLGGDRCLKRILQGWSEYLADDGRGFAISHLALTKGKKIESIARELFQGFPGRALIVVIDSGDSVELAAAQSLHALDRGLAAYQREVDRWSRSLERSKVDSIALILAVAERTGEVERKVVDARKRSFSLPIGPGPDQVVSEWLSE